MSNLMVIDSTPLARKNLQCDEPLPEPTVELAVNRMAFGGSVGKCAKSILFADHPEVTESEARAGWLKLMSDYPAVQRRHGYLVEEYHRLLLDNARTSRDEILFFAMERIRDPQTHSRDLASLSNFVAELMGFKAKQEISVNHTHGIADLLGEITLGSAMLPSQVVDAEVVD